MTKTSFIIRTLFFDLVLIYMFFSTLQKGLELPIYVLVVPIIGFIAIGYGQVAMYKNSINISLFITGEDVIYTLSEEKLIKMRNKLILKDIFFMTALPLYIYIFSRKYILMYFVVIIIYMCIELFEYKHLKNLYMKNT